MAQMTPDEMLRLGMIMTPFNPVTGAALITAGTVDGQQTFEVQPDMLPKLLAGLERVRTKYEEAQNIAYDLASTVSPFGDDVTIETFREINKRAQGGENSLFDTSADMIKWIDDFKSAVEQAINDTERIDQANQVI
ncbi:hypothetical protein [Actinopolyspora mortivallis]|uniref:PE domain-containing protein n=1 Tax=Actinopolyspora mortivallis TaxID=33906 RepID=A0A2T0GYX9_ACTMO|nr:hypothetical protein [Actinopolyspora mortivallis]PRW64325.1 hypothetical protein CEP50_05135 [Actinopolyspora mortivallis]